MNDETVTDALLREFLLGKVTDEVRERIEGLFLTDPPLRERVLAAEQELIEDYLEGTLSDDDRELFVARYAQTAEQRRKLRISKSIKDWATTEAKATPPAIQVPAPVSIWRRAFVVPIAAAVLIAILVAAFWLSAEGKHARLERELAQLNDPSNTTAASAQLAVTPGTVRSSGPQAQLNPPPASGEIELLLLLLGAERYSSYTVTIHRVGDSESYTVRSLSPTSDGKAVRLRLRAQFLTRGLWQITVTPNGASSSDEYQLTVGE